MSEVYTHPQFMGDRIAADTSEIQIPNPEMLIEAIDRFDGNLCLINNTAPGALGRDYGRYKSSRAELCTDHYEHTRQVVLLCSVGRRGHVDKSGLKHEIIRLAYQLIHEGSDEFTDENVVLDDDIIEIRTSPEVISNIEVCHLKEKPLEITFSITASLSYDIDTAGVYDQIKEVFQLYTHVLDAVAPIHEYSSLPTSPKFPIAAPDFSIPKIHENDMRYAHLLWGVYHQYETLATRVPPMVYDHAGLVQLARDFPAVDLDEVHKELIKITNGYRRLNPRIAHGAIGPRELRLIVERLASASGTPEMDDR